MKKTVWMMDDDNARIIGHATQMVDVGVEEYVLNNDVVSGDDDDDDDDADEDGLR